MNHDTAAATLQIAMECGDELNDLAAPLERRTDAGELQKYRMALGE